MPRLFLAPLLLLAACATPQERCIARATEDLRVVSALIEESRATIARGYAFEIRQDDQLRYTFCADRDGQRSLCWVRDAQNRRIPVAVNLDEERAKLATLIEKRGELEATARAEIAACEAASN